MNVILVILDTLRKDHIGAYGSDWIKTPNFDALAKESLRFTRAYPESIPTIPARRAVHTGLRTWPFRNWIPQEGIPYQPYGWQRIPEDQVTLAEILLENGYHTMLVTDTHHQFKPSMNFQRGFRVYDWIRGQERDYYRPPEICPRDKLRESLTDTGGRLELRQYFANTVGRKTEEDWFAPQTFLKAAQFLEWSQREPFFMVVDSYDPHEPWDPPEKYTRLYDDGYNDREPYTPVYGPSSYLTDRQLKRIRALYAGEITMVDRWFGNFLDKVDSLHLMENTLLILVGDHGHILGEHGLVGKLPYGLYHELTDIPFFIRHPDGKGAGEVSDHYASTHDIAPTVLGALGIEPAEPMDGQDLSVLLEGNEPEARPYITLGFHKYASARDDRYALISLNDGRRAQLYDLQADSQMNNNIAEDHPDIVKRMFDDYIIKDAGGPLPNYGGGRRPNAR
jgi:arylsulfatase A-like enzyme